MNDDDGSEFEVELDCELRVRGNQAIAIKTDKEWMSFGEPIHLSRIEIVLRAFTTINRLNLRPDDGKEEQEPKEEATEAREAPTPSEPPEGPKEEKPLKELASTIAIINIETKQLPLCECGCGKPVKNKRHRYLKGHAGAQASKKTFQKPATEPEPTGPKPLCACGCGDPVKMHKHKFIHGHSGGVNTQKINPAREEGKTLLKEGKRPKDIFKILKEKYGDEGPSTNLIHQWRHELKKEGELPDKKTVPAKKKFGNLVSKKTAVREAPSKETLTKGSKEPRYMKCVEQKRTIIAADIACINDYMGPEEGSTCGACAHCQPAEQGKPEAPVSSAVNKEDFRGFIKAKLKGNDLAIIGDKVMCPIEGRHAVEVETCRECNSYMTVLNCQDTEEPYVRCAKA